MFPLILWIFQISTSIIMVPRFITFFCLLTFSSFAEQFPASYAVLLYIYVGLSFLPKEWLLHNTAPSPVVGPSLGTILWQSPGSSNTVLWPYNHHFIATELLLIWSNCRALQPLISLYLLSFRSKCWSPLNLALQMAHTMLHSSQSCQGNKYGCHSLSVFCLWEHCLLNASNMVNIA